MSNCSSACPPYRRLIPCLLALAVSAAVSTASAQSTATTRYSSSSDLAAPIQALSYASESGQNSGGYGQGGYKQYPKYGNSRWDHVAIEAGAGFDAPIGNTKKTQTYGYNVKFGGGWNFNQRVGLLLEYEFNRTGIPDSVLAANQTTSGTVPNGNVHLWGLTLDPIIYLKNTGGWGAYVTGGGGFYRKLTSFTEPVYLGVVCDYFYGCYPAYGNQLISHFSSNQGGLNVGAGFTHGFGDGRMKLFGEARYLWVNSPSSSASQLGTGTVSMIPVTFGVRF
jgi:hypothetical protein